jgi:hypothetical protein
VKTAVSGVKAEADHVTPKGSVAELCFNQGEVAAIELAAHFPFKEHSEAFV